MKRLVSVVLFATLASAPLGAAETSTPATLPDWKIELVAAAPAIRHPSVVCSAPDGRIFVAEDPMDISTARADAQEGRIVCFHPDGRATVFADKLYAVFGMQYLEGKLYVLHNPKFSVFTDREGVGDQRVELIEQTNPDPWALNWNDHVPANFRLGLDGYFYVAVGDKGLYGAQGTDGRRVDLQGGGIVRLRPDGSGLEVFCRGVRNILDVAMNEEDDFFTYDNTDEQQWMGRLTHMVDGGFYGYPYDFIPRRPYTLWMMADYGAGAATGTLCYNEDALPAAYHGNLFLADFGKRQVMRVELKRAGGSYTAVKKTNLFPDPPADFRPVGIGWSADGLSMLICDWHHRDTKENVTVGRLWKLTFKGESQAAPKPPWYVAAATSRPFTATTEELLQGLGHPSHQVRLTAQRRLIDLARTSSPSAHERRSSSPVKELSTLLGDERSPLRARRHALWALDGIDRGASARAEILRLAVDPDPALRRQTLRQLGGQRSAEAMAVMVAGLKDADASVRFHAATALGRSAAVLATPQLLGALAEKDFFTRYAVFTALNRIGRERPGAWAEIVPALNGGDPYVREGVEFALRDTYDLSLVQALAQSATNRSIRSEVREISLRLLSAVALEPEPYRGQWWAYHPVNAPPPLLTMEWAGTSTVTDALVQGLRDVESAVRLAAVNGIRTSRRVSAAGDLRELFAREATPSVQAAILETLGALGDAAAAPMIHALLQSRPPHPLLPSAIAAAGTLGGDSLTQSLLDLLREEVGETNIAMRVMAALGELKNPEASALVALQLKHPGADLRTAAAEALIKIGGPSALKALLELIETTHPQPPAEAVSALGKLRRKEAVPALLKLYEANIRETEVMEALARLRDPRALDAYLHGLGSKNAAQRDQARNALREMQNEVLGKIEAQAAQLAPEVIAELRTIYDKNTTARTGAVFAVNVALRTPADYARFAKEQPGNAARGRAIFMNEAGAACIKCHTLGQEGRAIGPDLSNIGTQFDKAALIESILHPSRVVREGYQQIILELVDDETISGLLKAESAEEITILDASGQVLRLPKAQIKRRRPSYLSLMPEGLQAGLTLSEFADLVAFLESLKVADK